MATTPKQDFERYIDKGHSVESAACFAGVDLDTAMKWLGKDTDELAVIARDYAIKAMGILSELAENGMPSSEKSPGDEIRLKASTELMKAFLVIRKENGGTRKESGKKDEKGKVLGGILNLWDFAKPED